MPLYKQIPLLPLGKWSEGQMLVPLFAMRGTLAQMTLRFGVRFEDRFENGMGQLSVARVVTETGNDYVLSHAKYPGEQLLIEGWVPKDPSGHPSREMIEAAIADLGLAADDVLR